MSIPRMPSKIPKPLWNVFVLLAVVLLAVIVACALVEIAEKVQ